MWHLECVITSSFTESPNNFNRIVEDTSESPEPTFTRPKEMATNDNTCILSKKKKAERYSVINKFYLSLIQEFQFKSYAQYIYLVKIYRKKLYNLKKKTTNQLKIIFNFLAHDFLQFAHVISEGRFSFSCLFSNLN